MRRQKKKKKHTTQDSLRRDKEYLETFHDEDIIEGSGLNIFFPEEKEDVTLESEEFEKEEISDEENKQREEFFLVHNLDILSLDSSCIEDFLPAPAVKNAEVSGYDARSERGGTQFAQVSYSCKQSYQLEDPQVHALSCQERRWRGKLPKCIKNSGKEEGKETCGDVGSCAQVCHLEESGPVCSCYDGFILADDG
jgi:hypothetical protein